MEPRLLLRTEGLAVALAAVVAYHLAGGPLWLFAVLALAPDLSMVGYLAGARAGSRLYNAAHTYLGPLALGAAGVGLAVPPLQWAALVWAGHIGVDRAVGYGLKYPTGFDDTHLSADADRRPGAAVLDDLDLAVAGDD